MKNSNRLPIFILIGLAVLVAIAAAVGNSDDPVTLEKISVSGSVSTITPDTAPIRLDFVAEGTGDTISTPISEEGVYSVQVIPGTYKINMAYSVSGIVSPAPGFCGTYPLDGPTDDLNIRC